MHKLFRTLGVLASSAILLLTAGCGGSADRPTAPDGQQALSVVVAFYPFAFIAERVAGADAQVTSLTQPGAEPHDIELTPKQIASLTKADVVIHQQGFQPAVDKALADARPKRVIDVAQLVPMHPQTMQGDHDHADQPDSDKPESGKPESGKPDGAPGQGRDSHDHDHAHDHEGHDHGGGVDPHQWLDPTNMNRIAAAVQSELTAARPERGTVFEQNGTRLQGELNALDEEFTAGLSTCRRREFITSHAAFGYLAERYKLTQIAVRGLSPEDEPSPARIAEVQQEAREHGVTTIFYETLVSPEISRAIAGDLHLRTDVLDPLEGITDASRGKDYLEVQRANLKALQTANECG